MSTALGMLYCFTDSIAKLCAKYPKFQPSNYKGAYIVKVWVALRKIFFANHWAVIFKLDNGKFGITQLDTSGNIGLSDTYNSLEDASSRTWGGLGNRVRLSCYGSCCKNYINWINSFYGGKSFYQLLIHDCQNFAREVVFGLNGKLVGVWPIEDGPSFGKRNIPDLDEIANEAKYATPLVVLNPVYWIARWLAD